jgi:hypothetical protein
METAQLLMNEITNKDSNPNSSCNFHSSTNENPGGFFLVFGFFL